MMGYGMGGAGLLGTLFAIIVLADLILVGIWLWQHIQKK